MHSKHNSLHQDDDSSLHTNLIRTTTEKTLQEVSQDVLTFILSFLPTLDIVTSVITVSHQFHHCSIQRLKSFHISLLQDETIPIRNESTRWSSKTMASRCVFRKWPRHHSQCSIETLEIQLHHLIMLLNGTPLPTVHHLDVRKTIAKVGSRDQLVLSQLPFSLKYDSSIFGRLKTIFPNLESMDIPHLNEDQGLIDVYVQWPELKSLRMGMMAMKDEKSTKYSQRDPDRPRLAGVGAHNPQWIAGWIEQLREERQQLFLFEPNKVGFRFEHLTSLHINSREKHYMLLSENDLPQFLYVVERCPNLEDIVFFRNQSPILRMLQAHLNEDDNEFRESNAYHQHLKYWEKVAKLSKLKSITILDDFIDWNLHFFMRHLKKLESLKILGPFAGFPSTTQDRSTSNMDEVLELLQNNPKLRVLKIKDRDVSNAFYQSVVQLGLPLENLHLRVRDSDDTQDRNAGGVAQGIPPTFLHAAGLSSPSMANSNVIVPDSLTKFAIWDTNAFNHHNLTPRPALQKLTICCNDAKYLPSFSTFFPTLSELTVLCRSKRVFVESDTIKKLTVKSQYKHGSCTKDLAVDACALEDFQISHELLKDLTHLNVISNQTKPLRLHNAVNLTSLYYSSPNQSVLVLIAKDLEQLQLCTPKLSLLMATANNFAFVSDEIMQQLDRCLVIQSTITMDTLKLFHGRVKSLKSLLFFNCSFELSRTQHKSLSMWDETSPLIPSVDRLVINQLRGVDIDLADFVTVVPNCCQLAIHCTPCDDLSTLKGLDFAADSWKLSHVQLDTIVVNKDMEKFLLACPELTHLTYQSQVQELTPLKIPKLEKLWLLKVGNSLVEFEHKHPRLFHLEVSPLYFRSPSIEQLDSNDVFEMPRMNQSRGADNDLLKKQFAIRDSTAREEMCMPFVDMFEFCPNLNEFYSKSIFTEEAMKKIVGSCLKWCGSNLQVIMFEWVRENAVELNAMQLGDTIQKQDKLQEFINEKRPDNPPLCYVFV